MAVFGFYRCMNRNTSPATILIVAMPSDFDQERLHYLRQAVRLGSIRGAAERLNVNPSTVSRQIALLEKQVSTTLLERYGRGVRATEAGQLLVEYAGIQDSARKDTLAKLADLKTLKRGHIELVTGEGYIGDLLGGPLQEFCRRFPDLTFSLEITGTDGIVQAVVGGEAQIGIVYFPPADRRLQSHARIRQPICAIVHPKHPLAKLGRAPKLSDVAHYPVAELRGSFGTQKLMEVAAASERTSFNPVVRTNSFLVLKSFVCANLGTAFMPAFAAAREVQDGEVIALPIDHPLLRSAEAHIITRHGRRLPPATLGLLQHLIKRMKAFEPFVANKSRPHRARAAKFA
jgi:DNA-binding transcriptional LysR family regulator